MGAHTYILKRKYGRSYFGSGGAWGEVRTCPNCRVTGTVDNGFVRSPRAVEVIDPSRPAVFVAEGGDDIGDGRRWCEAARWDPSSGSWVTISLAEAKSMLPA